MDTASFLKTVITTEEGWFQLLVGPPSGSGWHEEWFYWPTQLPEILSRAQAASRSDNVYFTAHLFSAKQSTKNNVLPTRTIQADLDEAVVPVTQAPTVLVETSPNRHQGFWILRDKHEPELLEQLSRALTYSIPDADRSGWSLGHKMRLPGTYNYKYPSGAKPVKVISATLTLYKDLKVGQIEAVQLGDASLDEWTAEPLEDIGVRQLWAKYKNKVPRAVSSVYDKRVADRSAALWGLLLALFRAGANRTEVFWLAKESANNKFADNKYHADLDLAKDVLRAERNLNSEAFEGTDIKTRIMEARKLAGLAAERRAYISALVRDNMQQQGSFLAANNGMDFYIREDSGRPIVLSRESEYLNALLETRYGLNVSEVEHRYAVGTLQTTTKERGRPGLVAQLSHFDSANNTLLLHTGRKDVMMVDGSSITTVANGNLGVIFPWRPQEEPFDPDLQSTIQVEDLFEGCFENLVELSAETAMAIVRTWLVFLLLRNDAASKPILALFGQPGSGKSTLFRRIYAFLYGSSKALNSITTSDDFDFAVSQDPLVVFDNVDTFSTWLPDKLALSAASSDLIKRKLYTDMDLVVLKRQALVGITAHNPKFRREDIVDRLLMINFHRLKSFAPEGDIIQRILLNRDALWGALLRDVQAVLAYPRPDTSEIPSFRVNDFARLGLWISRALGYEDAFRAALKVNQTEQVAFNLEEESVLIDAISIWLMRSTEASKRTWSAGELFTILEGTARDPLAFRRLYTNAISLSKKLWALQETLAQVFNVDFELNDKGTREWRFARK